MSLLFYTTLGCTLCEHAKDELAKVFADLNTELVFVDIASDDALIERYGMKIPVLRNSDTGQELNWPFDADQLLIWWQQCC